MLPIVGPDRVDEAAGIDWRTKAQARARVGRKAGGHAHVRIPSRRVLREEARDARITRRKIRNRIADKEARPEPGLRVFGKRDEHGTHGIPPHNAGAPISGRA
jgi:hypothetical protein